ncbi:5,6-dimethylbenzimidazole synthase [Aureibacter tunicatorum]|nr:5,6-dimethylbenzimidazole synthase [Aureibacter tunicatorum]
MSLDEIELCNYFEIMEKSRLFNSEEQRVLEEIILNRRDVRGNHFLDKPIEDDVLEKILMAGLNAPSVGFSQPWEFVVIKDKDIRNKIKKSFETESAKAAELFEDEKQKEYIKLKLEGITESPLNIAVYYVPKKGPVLGQTSMPDMGRFSVTCAIQNMWLMSRALNVGMGWVSILDPKEVAKVINAPDSHELIGYLCFGYTDMFYEKPELEILKWDERKYKDDVVFYEKYQ